MIEIVKKAIQFILNPKDRIEKNLTFKKKIKNIVVLYIFNFVISLIIAILVRIVFDVESLIVDKVKNEWNLTKLILVGVLLVPICEELIFRLPLIFKPSYIAISSFIFSFILISAFCFQIVFFNLEDKVFLRLILSSMISLVIYSITIKYFNKINNFWKNNFRFIYYLSIGLFGVFHLGNYELTFFNLLLFPLIILPQLISGSLLGYVRIAYGFSYSCLFHMMFNVVPLMI